MFNRDVSVQECLSTIQASCPPYGSSGLVSGNISDPYSLAKEVPERVRQQGQGAGLWRRDQQISDVSGSRSWAAMIGASTEASFFDGSVSTDLNHKPLGFSPSSPQVQDFPCDVVKPDFSHKPVGFSPVLPHECGSLRSPIQHPRSESLGLSSFSSCEGSTGQVPGATGTQVVAQADTESQVPRSLCVQTNIEDLSEPFTQATGPAFYQIFTEEDLCDVDSETGVDPCWDQPWDALTNLLPDPCPDYGQQGRPPAEHPPVFQCPTLSASGILKRPIKQRTVQDHVHHGKRITWQVPLVGLGNSSCRLVRAQVAILPWRMPVESPCIASPPLFWPSSQLVSCRNLQTSMPGRSRMWTCLPIQTGVAASCNLSAPSQPVSNVFLDLRVSSVTSITRSGCNGYNVSEPLQLRWGEPLHPDTNTKIAESDVEGVTWIVGSESEGSEYGSEQVGEDGHSGAHVDKVCWPQANCGQPGAQADKVHCSQPGVHADKVCLVLFNGAKPGFQASDVHLPYIECRQLGDQVQGDRSQEPLVPRPIRFNSQHDPSESAQDLLRFSPSHVRFSPAFHRVVKASHSATGRGAQASGVILDQCIQVREVGIAKAGQGATAQVREVGIAKAPQPRSVR